eukprot:scaffold27041_cov15-Tisochrysis_lutea.AAC.1
MQVMYETAVFDREERLRQELEQLNKTFPSTVRRSKDRGHAHVQACRHPHMHAHTCTTGCKKGHCKERKNGGQFYIFRSLVLLQDVGHVLAQKSKLGDSALFEHSCNLIFAALFVLELDPVSLDDAIDEMEQVGHDFFVYRDLESDQIQ